MQTVRDIISINYQKYKLRPDTTTGLTSFYNAWESCLVWLFISKGVAIDQEEMLLRQKLIKTYLQKLELGLDIVPEITALNSLKYFDEKIIHQVMAEMPELEYIYDPENITHRGYIRGCVLTYIS